MSYKVSIQRNATRYLLYSDADVVAGVILDSMAAAVEQAYVVLICFTENYKRSSSCRTGCWTVYDCIARNLFFKAIDLRS